MTPAFAAVAPPADPSAARVVLVLFVGVLIGAGLMRALDWWDSRDARPVCLNCGVAPVGEVGQYCARCSLAPGRLRTRPRPGDGGQAEPRCSVPPRPTPRLPDPGRSRPRSAHGLVPPPDRRWDG